MGPEVDPLQKQMRRTTAKQKQQQRICNMQASHAVVHAMLNKENQKTKDAKQFFLC